MAKVTRPKARINLGLQKEYDRNEIERMSFKKYRETVKKVKIIIL